MANWFHLLCQLVVASWSPELNRILRLNVSSWEGYLHQRLPPAGNAGVVTSMPGTHFLGILFPLCFTGRYSDFPNECLPHGRWGTLVGCLQGNPLLSSSLLLRQENPNTTFLPPWQPSKSGQVTWLQSMRCRQKPAKGTSGRTFISLMTSCLNWVECPAVTNIKDKQPVTAKDETMKTQKWPKSFLGP